MGVMGTFCRLCSLPVQHDHYIRRVGASMIEIYRGKDPDPARRSSRIGAEHAWLRDAVAVERSGERVRFGLVEDGTFYDDDPEPLFVGDGSDEAVVLHRYCYEELGSPRRPDAVASMWGSYAWALIRPYQGQLFELVRFIAHGKGWALVDPRLESAEAVRSRARIEACASAGGEPRGSSWSAELIDRARETERILRVCRVRAHEQTGYALRAIVRARLDGNLSLGSYDRLEQLEARVKAAVENAGAAIMLAAQLERGFVQLWLYARDEDATRTAVGSVDGAHEFSISMETSADPHWTTFLSKLDHVQELFPRSV